MYPQLLTKYIDIVPKILGKQKVKERKIRIEWGWWSFYADLRSCNPQYCWDGSVAVEKGEIVSLKKFNCWGLYGPSRESQITLNKNTWKSSIKPRNNKGLEGILLQVRGNSRTEIMVNFPKIQKVKFSLEKVEREKKIKFHIGSKYSYVGVTVSLENYDEFIVSREEIAQQSQQDGLARVLLENYQFQDAADYRDFFRVKFVWVAPLREVTADFELDKKPKLPCRILIKAMIADPSVGDRIDWSSWESDVRKHVKYKVYLNNRMVKDSSYFFSSFRACQKLEEIVFDVKPNFLHQGNNTISIQNGDDKVYLLVNRVFLLESSHPIKSVRKKWDEKPPVLAGVDLNIASPENGQIDYLLKYLKDERVGNYVLFRTEEHQTTLTDWQRWISFCRQSNIYFAIDPEGGRYPKKGVIPYIKEVIKIAKTRGGQYFVGVHYHEYSNLIYGWGKKEPLSRRKNRTMLQAKNAYVRHIHGLFKSCPEGVGKILGEAIPVHHYDYEAGIDICQSETMTGHTALLLSAARGADKSYNKKIWGVHIACHVHHFPEDWESQRMFWLNLYLSYLYGARIIYDEETAIMMLHGKKYSFSDKLPTQRREILKKFRQWCQKNPLSGKPVVNIGILQGNCGVFTGGVNIGNRPVKVWDGFSPETKEWEYLDPEYSWQYLDVFLPGVWLAPIKQNPLKVRQWFSGTPHGQVDLTPINSDTKTLKSYKLLILLGWNTMTEEIYEKLKEYTKSGGWLFMTLPHLSTRYDRKFLLGNGDLKLLKGGNYSDLFGVKIKNGIEYTTARILTMGSKGKDPLLVENRFGKGKAYLLITHRYPVEEALHNFVANFLKNLARQVQEEPVVHDLSKEVNYFVFKEDNTKKLYLVNTDWTKAGNIKTVRVCWAEKVFLVKVREGEVTSLILK